MTTQFPAALDDFENPLPSDSRNNPSHSAQHANANDAIEAIEAYLGVSTSTDPATITGRIAALEAGGGSVAWANITGKPTTLSGYGITDAYTKTQSDANYPTKSGAGATGTWAISISGISAGAPWGGLTGVPSSFPPSAHTHVIADVTGLQTALDGKAAVGASYTKAESDAKYFDVTGDTITGSLGFSDAATGGTGLIDVRDDPLSSIGSALVIDSPEGQILSGPYIILNSDNPQLTMTGGQVGALISVAAIDENGVVSLGYAQPLPQAYSVEDTADVDVVIKAANAAPNPTDWVALGLQVTLAEDIPAGTGNGSFEVILSNPTTRTGVVEFGLRVNAIDPTNEVIFQIPANYLQTTATAVPLQRAFATGDVVELVARVTSNNNNQFELIMDATPNVASFRIWAIGAATGGGGGGSVESVGATAPVTSTGGINPVIGMPRATASVDGYLDNADFATFAGKLGPTDNAASATVAGGVDDLNSTQVLKQWVGTQAQYDALGAWDASTFYNITDAQTPSAPVEWVDVENTPTTLGGYGITDAYTKTQSDANYPTKSGAGATGTWAISISGISAGAPWGGLTGVPSSFPPSAHTHVIADVTGLQTALDGKLGATSPAVSVVDEGAAATVKFWTGTEAEYQAIPTKDPATVYLMKA